MKPVLRKVQEKEVGSLVKKSNLLLTMNPNKHLINEQYFDNLTKFIFDNLYDFCELKGAKDPKLTLRQALTKPPEVEYRLEKGPNRKVLHIHALCKFTQRDGYVNFKLPELRNFLEKTIGNSWVRIRPVKETSSIENYIRKIET